MNPASEREIDWLDEPQDGSQSIQCTEIFESPEARQEKTEGAKRERPPEVQITDILLRNDDFSYGVKRDKAMAFLKDALDKSPRDFAELLANINAELKKRGSSLRLQAHCKEEKRIEEEHYISAEAGLQQPLRSYPAKRTTENVAIVKLTNRFGETEDEAKIQSKPLKIEYNQNRRGEPEWRSLITPPSLTPPISPFQRLRGQ